jgi:hypothetical protein
MKSWPKVASLVIGIAFLIQPAKAADDAGLRQGDRLELGGRTVEVLTLDTLPCVANKYTERSQFDKYGDPALEKLRRDYHLDDVVATGGNEFEKQLLLMEWANAQIQYGDPAELAKVRDPLKLLELSQKGRVLYCECFASLYISAAASMGWVCRPVDISSHSFTETWSNQYRKWVLFDPTRNLYVEKDNMPLATAEAVTDWFENGGKGLVFKRGRERRVGPGRQFHNFETLYYVLQRQWLGNRPADGAIVVKYKSPATLAADRAAGKAPEVDLYVPVNQAALTVTPEGRNLKVSIRTWTPNFKTYRIRLDEGAWTDSSNSFTWPLHAGLNLLEVKSVNLFDVDGPLSTVEVRVGDQGNQGNKPSREIVLAACAFSAEGGGRSGNRSRDGDAAPAYVHLWNTPGHWLEWTFECPATGDYDVTLTYATLFRPARQLSLNGEVVKDLERFAVGSTRRWDNFSESLLPARLKLRAGRNVLRLTSLDGLNLLLSQIRLSNPSRPDILIAGTAYTGEGGGQAWRMVSPKDGYIRFWDNAGHWLEWTIEDAAAGTYTAYLQYAALWDAPRKLQVNNQNVPGLEIVVLPMTGNWTNWGECRLPAPLVLAKGRNVLRLTCSTGKGANLAGLRLVGADGKPCYIPAISFSGQDGGRVTAFSPSRHRSLTGWDAKGHWLEWTARKMTEGNYTIVLRYASDKPATREVRLTTNGLSFTALESCLLPATGGLQTWQEMKLPARVHLLPGDNVLRLTNVEGQNLNLDEVRLVPVEK